MPNWFKYTTSVLICFSSFYAFANNALYIATSNDMAKKIQLNVIANNLANANTNGYEQDSVIFKSVTHKESKKKENKYVIPKGNYRKGDKGSLKVTGNPLDMAILGPGYFKVITPNGPRYTLDGAGVVNNQNILVNSSGFPFASADNQPILLPEDYTLINMQKDGTIFAELSGDLLEEVGVVGIFDFPEETELMKEGGNLYYTTATDIVLDSDQTTLISGSLRTSNVNSTKALTEMIELQNSSQASQKLVTDIATLERNSVAKIMK